MSDETTAAPVYGSGAKFFHWAVAILLLAQWVIGLVHAARWR
jgi:cytochrome b561